MQTLNKVMLRRSELLARIAAQREQMEEIGARFNTPLAYADKGLAVARFLRAHPVLFAGAVALLPIRRGGVLIGLVSGAWRAWQGYRYLSAAAAKRSS